MKKEIISIIILFLLFLASLTITLFIIKWYENKYYSIEVTDTYYEKQIAAYKETVLNLHKKLSEIDTTTKEVIKYVYIERDNINEIVADLPIEPPQKDSINTIITTIIDTLVFVVNQKDTLLQQQDSLIASLYDFSKEMGVQIQNDAVQIQNLQQQLDEYKRKSTRRGWIIGGISFVGAAAIVTAILVK